MEQQEHAYETHTRISSLGERLAAEVSKAQSRLSEVLQSIMAPFQGGPDEQGPLSRRKLAAPVANPLFRPPHPASEGVPDELTGIIAGIQATNQQLRELEQNYQAVDSSLFVLQEGAEQRDEQTAAYRDALLQLADDLEQQEAEDVARAAEQARLEAEARRLEDIRREEAMWREMDELVAAASAVQVLQAGLAVAETSAAALAGAPPIKVDVGVQLQTKPGQEVFLVGSHPCLGEWSAEAALPLTWTDGHVWQASIEVPADCIDLEYKAVLRSPNGNVLWEKGNNHKADLLGISDVELFHVFQG
eukprot:GHRR01011416.1.p1 GENE.GHRR01011416.1~~GHRR01011416.1.p1  ORF type:complete len:304 (+),score=119.92 GHRR01011416.1:397-1308(+)